MGLWSCSTKGSWLLLCILSFVGLMIVCTIVEMSYAQSLFFLLSVVVVGTAHVLMSGAFGRGVRGRLGGQRTGVEPVA